MLVSVAMCTYNGEKYIKEQLVSILHQSVVPDEIIICDDNSDDQTIEIINQTLANTSIPYKIIKNTPAKGVVNNFMYAISLCQFDIVITCDQDDVWMDNKIQKIKTAFATDDTIKLVFSDALVVDQDLQPYSFTLWNSVSFKFVKNTYKKTELLSTLFSHCIVTGATMAFDKSIFNPQYDIENSGWLHDGWLAIIANTNFSVYAIYEPLIKYRQHGNNEVGTTDEKSLATALGTHLKSFSKFKNSINTRFSIYLKEANTNFNKYSFYREYLKKDNIDLELCLVQELNQCIEFWKSKKEVSGKRFYTIFKLFQYLIRGYYKRFDKGLKGYLYDSIVIIFGKTN